MSNRRIFKLEIVEILSKRMNKPLTVLKKIETTPFYKIFEIAHFLADVQKYLHTDDTVTRSGNGSVTFLPVQENEN